MLGSKSAKAPGGACTVLPRSLRSWATASVVNGSVANKPATLLVHVSHSEASFSAAAVSSKSYVRTGTCSALAKRCTACMAARCCGSSGTLSPALRVHSVSVRNLLFTIWLYVSACMLSSMLRLSSIMLWSLKSLFWLSEQQLKLRLLSLHMNL